MYKSKSVHFASWMAVVHIWACKFNNLRSVMAYDGGNDYKQAHNEGQRHKRDTDSAGDFTVNIDDYDRCVRLCR